MGSSSRSTSRSRSYPEMQKICGHGIPALFQTSHTEKSPEHRFYVCRHEYSDDCGLWQWIDPELTSYYKLRFKKLKLERDNAVKHLRNRLLVDESNMMKFEDTDFKSLAKELDNELKKMAWRIKFICIAFGFFCICVFCVGMYV
ncbi:uncharacterized protein LOC131018779 [Salvia miltiorrhiza]|uniref:uncharacterized protein LOC131018779 n=1 Tax=Salvia miltiorrhiza TaxID=226208 RepID=UPI0025AD70BB|nr:uncharacterized protein LOC131018779 [Salvia miltiorrhiza]